MLFMFLLQFHALLSYLFAWSSEFPTHVSSLILLLSVLLMYLDLPSLQHLLSITVIILTCFKVFSKHLIFSSIILKIFFSKGSKIIINIIFLDTKLSCVYHIYKTMLHKKTTKLPTHWSLKVPKRHKQNWLFGDFHRVKSISANFDAEVIQGTSATRFVLAQRISVVKVSSPQSPPFQQTTQKGSDLLEFSIQITLSCYM